MSLQCVKQENAFLLALTLCTPKGRKTSEGLSIYKHAVFLFHLKHTLKKKTQKKNKEVKPIKENASQKTS